MELQGPAEAGGAVRDPLLCPCPCPLLPAFAAFLLTACILDFRRALALFVLTCVVLVFLAHSLGKRLLGPRLLRCVRPLGSPRLNLWLKR